MNDLELFKQEAESFIAHTVECLEKTVVNDSLYKAMLEIRDCKGIVITTGMGKNYHAAKKISSTFSSLGTPSCCIHPGESLHGDSGVIREEDILLVLSTSGKTEEVIEIIGTARDLNVSSIICLTSHLDSEIRPLSDIIVDIGVIPEAGYLGLAPTTSILAMMMTGDILATTVAKEKNITRHDYHKRHHHGYLGKASSGK